MSSPGSAHRTHKSSKLARGLAIAGLVVVVLVIAIRLLLDPIAAHETRKALASMKGASGDFARVHVTVFPPGYTITRLKLLQDGSEEPIFYADAVHVGLDWQRLFKRQVGAGVRVSGPKVTVTAGKAKAPKGAPKAPDLSQQLQQLFPFEIERVEVFEGEVLFRDDASEGKPEVWLHDISLTAQNLATRMYLGDARPATVSAKAVVGKTGHMDVFVSADPLASPLAFAGRFEVVGLRLAELYRFIAPKTKLQAPAGTLDLFAEFKARGGRIRGGVKPVLKNVEVRAADDGVWTAVKAWAADIGVELASDRVPGRNAVAATVPIEGRLADPDVQLWPAVLGVVRNAFVEGVASGFSNLPPAKAAKPEAPLEQARRALDKEGGEPKAQPAPSEGEAK